MSRLFSATGSPGGTAENPRVEQFANKSASKQLHSTAEGHKVESLDPVTHVSKTRKTTWMAVHRVDVITDVIKQTKYSKTLPGTSNLSFSFSLHSFKMTSLISFITRNDQRLLLRCTIMYLPYSNMLSVNNFFQTITASVEVNLGKKTQSVIKASRFMLNRPRRHGDTTKGNGLKLQFTV